jgi:hypothetical protein
MTRIVIYVPPVSDGPTAFMLAEIFLKSCVGCVRCCDTSSCCRFAKLKPERGESVDPS